jgi:hypothetical protein
MNLDFEYYSLIFNFSSSNCFLSTTPGAWLISSAEVATFGKAITSRILEQSSINITSLSSPKARPPCGGAPNLNASTKKYNTNYYRWSEGD